MAAQGRPHRANLHVTWRDGSCDFIDMTGVLSETAVFMPLRHPRAFAAMCVVAYGTGMEWGDDALDQSADSFEELAAARRSIALTGS